MLGEIQVKYPFRHAAGGLWAVPVALNLALRMYLLFLLFAQGQVWAVLVSLRLATVVERT